MLWAGNSRGEGSTFSSIGWTIELHDMGGLGLIKVSDCPKDADMLAAFAVFSMLTLGVDIKGSTCPGNPGGLCPHTVPGVGSHLFYPEGSPRIHLVRKDKELYQ